MSEFAGYDAWKLMDPWTAGFYVDPDPAHDDDDDGDPMDALDEARQMHADARAAFVFFVDCRRAAEEISECR